MYGQPTDHRFAEKAIALMFGDMLVPFQAAAARAGSEATAFMLSQMATNFNATVDTLAAVWVAKLDRPLDYGLLELLVAMHRRVKRNPLLLWRIVRTMKKAAIYPPMSVSA